VVEQKVKKLRTMETCKKQKIVTTCACFSAATTLTSKIIAEITETILNFMGAQIAAINLLQVDLDIMVMVTVYCFI